MSPITRWRKHDFKAWALGTHRGYAVVLNGGYLHIQVEWVGRSRRSRSYRSIARVRIADVLDPGWRLDVARVLRELRRMLREMRAGS